MELDEQQVVAASWREHAATLLDSGATMLDFLTAVDEPAAGELQIVLHVVDVAKRRRYLVCTRIAREEPRIESLVAVYRGAAWHEREVHEMFGVRFDGNPDLRPLLTDGTLGHPLLRTTPLPRRVTTSWPGAADPADRPARPAGATGAKVATRPRSRLRPPGIPEDWTAEAESGRGDRR